MRSFGHWTPRYVADRVRELRYCRANPDAPWLTPQANHMFSTLLSRRDRGLEWGSGRSTVWLARRVDHLTSVEHDHEWYGMVSSRLKAAGLDNVDHVFMAPDAPPERGTDSEYARAALRFADDSLGFVLVDGVYRDACTRLAVDKLAPGGLLVVDNVNRYLPSRSRSPQSRRPAQGAASQLWSQLAPVLLTWRHIWTSSGVSDTAIFVKPPDQGKAVSRAGAARGE